METLSAARKPIRPTIFSRFDVDFLGKQEGTHTFLPPYSYLAEHKGQFLCPHLMTFSELTTMDYLLSNVALKHLDAFSVDANNRLLLALQTYGAAFQKRAKNICSNPVSREILIDQDKAVLDKTYRKTFPRAQIYEEGFPRPEFLTLSELVEFEDEAMRAISECGGVLGEDSAFIHKMWWVRHRCQAELYGRFDKAKASMNDAMAFRLTEMSTQFPNKYG